MKVLCFTLGVLGGLLCSSLTALAATLDEYQKRIEAAAIETAGLAKTGDRDDAAIAEVRRLVPASEIVDWKGGSATTDNSWLSAGLEEYAEETDVAKRRAIMAGLSKRLEAIAQKLDQLRRTGQRAVEGRGQAETRRDPAPPGISKTAAAGGKPLPEVVSQSRGVVGTRFSEAVYAGWIYGGPRLIGVYPAVHHLCGRVCRHSVCDLQTRSVPCGTFWLGRTQ